MARMIPPQIFEDCSSAGERDIFYRLREGNGTDGWFVLHSLCLAEHVRQISGEIDFVVIVPGMGVLCLEVKACTRIRRDRGLWYFGTDPQPDARGPFRQASEALHSLRAKLVKRRPDLGCIPFWSAVLFPYVSFPEQSPEWHEWQLIDRAKLGGRPLPDLLRTVLKNARIHLAACPTSKWFDAQSSIPTPDQCETVVTCLRGDFEVTETPASARHRRESDIIRFTEEQFCALDAMQDNNRVIFAGPAGTGKTVLALEAVRRATSEGQKTLFLCFNTNLGKFLHRACERFARAEAKTLHRLMVTLVGDNIVPQGASDDFWRRDLPEMALLKAIESGNQAASYDFLVIDEAQDIIREEYLEFLDTLLKGGLRSGRWMMFGDFEKQVIYDGFSFSNMKNTVGLDVPIYRLRTNCRNIPRVAAAAHLLGGLTPDYAKVLRPDEGSTSDPIYRFYDSPQTQTDMLTEVLENFYKAGFQGCDITILSPFNPPKAAVASLPNDPWKQRVKPYGMPEHNHVTFSTVHAFKGLEAPAIVVTDLESIKSDTEQALLYIAITRAQDRLALLISERAKRDLMNAVYAGPI